MSYSDYVIDKYCPDRVLKHIQASKYRSEFKTMGSVSELETVLREYIELDDNEDSRAVASAALSRIVAYNTLAWGRVEELRSLLNRYFSEKWGVDV